MLSIVVPTFKEADNLPLLAEKIHACTGISSAEASVDYELIVVDDMSPDDTVEVCGRLSKIYPLKLLRRDCLLYTSPSPRDKRQSRMPSSA